MEAREKEGSGRRRAEGSKSEADRSSGEGVGLMKTREILAATRITHQTLYRYVTLGLIAESDTTAGGQRLFHPDVVALIEQIQELNDTGYSLRDIKEIFFKEPRVQRLCRKRSP